MIIGIMLLLINAFLMFMETILKTINKLALFLVLIAGLVVLVQIIYWLPDIAQSIKRLNVAKCLESYNAQGQPPLGACGFDFK